MTQTQTPPTTGRPHPDLPPAAPPRRLPLGLSAAQLVGTALAAVTATFAASFLGVYGTVIGAGLISFLTAVGGAVYTQSIRRTGAVVRDVVPITVALPVSRSVLPADREDAVADARHVGLPVDLPPELPAPRPVGRRLWRAVALATLTVFVAVLAVVTVVEIVVGRPVSDIVRGDSGHGTSLFGGVQTHTVTVPATPTVTVTVTPRVKVVTPTVTSTAPATTRTATGSPTSTPVRSGIASAATSSGAPASPTATRTTGATDPATASAQPTSTASTP